MRRKASLRNWNSYLKLALEVEILTVEEFFQKFWPSLVVEVTEPGLAHLSQEPHIAHALAGIIVTEFILKLAKSETVTINNSPDIDVSNLILKLIQPSWGLVNVVADNCFPLSFCGKRQASPCGKDVLGCARIFLRFSWDVLGFAEIFLRFSWDVLGFS